MLPNYPESTRRGLARNILRNSLHIARGENLLIETWSGTLDWATSFVLEGRIAGARPMLVVEDEETLWKSVREARPADVGRVGSHDWAALKASDAHVYLYGPSDVEAESTLPSSIRRRIDADDHEWFRLVAKFGVRCARFDIGRTSEVSAKRYGVDVETWRRELIEAATVDPGSLRSAGQPIARAMRLGKVARITHPNGTDLTLHLARREPRLDDGAIDEADMRAGNAVTFIPSGVVSTTVDESWAEGRFVANSAGVLLIPEREVPLFGGTFEFRKGRLSAFSFERGGETFRKEYARFGPGKERPGLLSVGLNAKISTIPLLFDQALGVLTIAIGRNVYHGGATRTPRFTAYGSLIGGTLQIDGRTLVDAGELA